MLWAELEPGSEMGSSSIVIPVFGFGIKAKFLFIHKLSEGNNPDVIFEKEECSLRNVVIKYFTIL